MSWIFPLAGTERDNVLKAFLHFHRSPDSETAENLHIIAAGARNWRLFSLIEVYYHAFKSPYCKWIQLYNLHVSTLRENCKTHSEKFSKIKYFLTFIYIFYDFWVLKYYNCMDFNFSESNYLQYEISKFRINKWPSKSINRY